MKIRDIVFILLVGLLISCNYTYKEYDKKSFTSLSWKKGQQISFRPEITDTTKTYDLILGIRHIYESKVKDINVSVKTISPSGKETVKAYLFQLRNENNEPLASSAGNMCDLETVVDNIKFSEAGEYQVIVTNDSEASRIFGVMEFGLIIDEKD